VASEHFRRFIFSVLVLVFLTVRGGPIVPIILDFSRDEDAIVRVEQWLLRIRLVSDPSKKCCKFENGDKMSIGPSVQRYRKPLLRLKNIAVLPCQRACSAEHVLGGQPGNFWNHALTERSEMPAHP
jgi:hypothetical protein